MCIPLTSATGYRAPSPKYFAAYTLIELVMVMVIMGALAAISLPRFFDRAVFENRFYVDQLTHVVRYARKVAVASGCRVQLVTTPSSLQLLRDDNCLNGNPPAFSSNVVHAPGGNSDATVITGLPGGLSFSAATTTFLPDGRIAGTMSISLAGETVTMVPETGYVSR